MAKRRGKPADDGAKAVSSERAGRLYKLLTYLASKPMTRAALLKRLGLDVRGFYRDLELLRAAGIDLPLSKGRYSLQEVVSQAAARLPFPDPHLTLGEAMVLSRGRTTSHRKLKALVREITKK
jgi:hypothetical protein